MSPISHGHVNEGKHLRVLLMKCGDGHTVTEIMSFIEFPISSSGGKFTKYILAQRWKSSFYLQVAEVRSSERSEAVAT